MNNKNILDIINKFDYFISGIVLILVLYFNNDVFYLVIDSKETFIPNIISIYGTLLGFILTSLSIFIVFRTDKDYDNQNNNESLRLLLSNKKFNQLYTLFLKNIYSIVLSILFSIICLVLRESHTILFGMIWGLYILFVFLTFLRTILSILAVRSLIVIITQGNK